MLTLIAFVAWIGTVLAWLFLQFSSSWAPGSRLRRIIFVLVAPLIFAGSYALASTDWPPRAALEVSRPGLERLTASPPKNGELDDWVGLHHVTWIHKDRGGTSLTVAPINLGVVEFLFGSCSLLQATPAELKVFKDQSEDYEETHDLNHLTDDWYTYCSAASD